MAGGGMMGAAPTNVGQMGGGMPMAGTTPAPTSPAQPAGLQFGTAGVGTGAVQESSPMAQQMQSPAPMQNPYAQQMARPQMMPQQPMYRQQMSQPQYGGLQSLLNNLLNRYQQPQQRYSQAPQYQSRALGYRPNIAGAQQNLSRVAPSVELQQRRAAEAAAEEARLRAEAEPAYDYVFGVNGG
jgi:hypothetical protein